MNPINHVAIIMDGNGRWGIKNKKWLLEHEGASIQKTLNL